MKLRYCIPFFLSAIITGLFILIPTVYANPPYIPVDLTYTYNPLTQEVVFTWKQTLTVPTGYRVYRDHELLATIANEGSAVYSYSTTLTEYGIYAFHIRAYNDDGESDLRVHRTITWLDPDNRAASLSQWGITWTFDREVDFGRFANGDLWVLGPVNIIGINPACGIVDGNTINGSMIDPYIRDGNEKQGYDSRQRNYHDSLNVALSVSAVTPLTINVGHSLVSVRSYLTGESTRYLRTAAVLTVLESAPPEGSFRPSFAAKNKTILYNKNNLDCSFLQSLPIPAGTTNLADIECQIEKVFLDHNGSDFMMEAFIAPVENMERYGRDVANIVENIALHLNLNYSIAEKEKLIINFVQMGLDLYGVIQASPNPRWNGWGGHFLGRKLPVLFAGVALNDNNIKNVEIQYPNLLFAENDITYYYNDPRLPVDAQNQFSWTGSKALYKFNYHWTDSVYKAIYEHKYPSEWTDYGDSVPYIPDNQCEDYRICCTAKYLVGIALGARLMGFISLWNNDSFFDYIDRWVYEDMTHFLTVLNGGTTTVRDIRDYALIGNPFSRVMWNLHRNLTDTEPPTLPENVCIVDYVNGTKKLTWNRCGDNVGGVGYYIYKNGAIVDTLYAVQEWIDTVGNSSSPYKVAAFDWTGNTTSTVDAGSGNNGNPSSEVPSNPLLYQNYPNPFNPETTISFLLLGSSNVSLKVFDLLGRELAILVDEEQMPAGNYEVKFEASRLSSGLYIYRLTSGSYASSKKMLLLK